MGLPDVPAVPDVPDLFPDKFHKEYHTSIMTKFRVALVLSEFFCSHALISMISDELPLLNTFS